MKWGLQRKEHGPYSQTWWRFTDVLGLLCCFRHWMSEDYQSILRRNVGPSVRKLGLRLRSWVLQQDNDPNHTSKAPQNGLRQSTGEFWRPAMSPNLNPIELIWRYLRTAVGRRNSSNLKDLEQLAKEEWSKIPKTHNGYRRQLISVFFFFFLRVCYQILSWGSQSFCPVHFHSSVWNVSDLAFFIVLF